MASLESPPSPLLMDNALVFADLKTALVVYTYRNVVTETEITAVYEWVKDALLSWFREDDFRGAIFDFRDVAKFAIGNVETAKEESAEANKIKDLSVFPIALIVNNTRQEVQVRMTMMGESTNRKQIVRDDQEALKFINTWNLQHGRKFNLSEEMMGVWPQYISN